MTFDSATPSQGTLLAGERHRHLPLGTLANGATASVQIKVTPTTGGHDHEPGERVREHRRPGRWSTTRRARPPTVDPVADLSVTKADSPDPVLSGQPLTYTLTVHNDGPASAPSVSLTDTLPAGVTYRVRDADPGQLRAHPAAR